MILVYSYIYSSIPSLYLDFSSRHQSQVNLSFFYFLFIASMDAMNDVIKKKRKRNARASSFRTEEAPPLPKLPDEVVVDQILVRLPVKSLLRFRSVCKAWQAIISPTPSSSPRDSEARLPSVIEQLEYKVESDIGNIEVFQVHCLFDASNMVEPLNKCEFEANKKG